MKKLLLPIIALGLIATSCKTQPTHEQLKAVFVDSCISSAHREMTRNGATVSKEMDQMLKEYCDCSGDKVVDNFTLEELAKIGKQPDAASQAKVEKLTQPCLDEFTQKVQAQQVQ